MNELLSIANNHTEMTIMAGFIGLTMVGMLVCLHKQKRLLEQVQRLQHDLRIANHGSIGMGQQIIMLEKQLQQLANPKQSGNFQSSLVHPPTAKSPTDKSVGESSTEKNLSSTSFGAQIQSTLGRKGSAENKIEPSFDTEAKGAVESLYTASHADDNLTTARYLLETGKKVSEVAEECHLSFAEVSLIQALNQSKTSSQSPLSS